MNADEILKTIRNNKEQLIRLGVNRIGLFGSHVRGEAKPDSDLDFLVDFVKGKKITTTSSISALCLKKRLAAK